VTSRDPGPATGPFTGRSLAELGRSLRAGETSAVALCHAALAAAAAHADLNAFTALDPDTAGAAAVRADAELARGVDRGPLHGMPVAVKDMIDTAGLATEMGSRHFAGRVPERDAGCVRSLREAGAVIVGKTTTHELAYGPTGDVSATGPVRNPRDRSRMTGGSSAGSAAAVAAGIVPLALGTDTGGSVRIPAALCGVVGLRPSPGRILRGGVFALAPSLDEVGPLAGSVGDVALAFAALAGASLDDFGTHRVQTSSGADRGIRSSRSARPPSRSLRIGVAEHPWFERTDPAVGAALSASIDALATAGAELHRAPVPDAEELADVYRSVQAVEAVALHAERMAHVPECFEPATLERLRAAAEVPAERSAHGRRRLAQLRAIAGERLAGLDLLLLPTVPILAPPIGDRSPQAGGWPSPREALLAFTAPWSVLGLPCLSLPAGLGLQLVGPPGEDEALLAAAAGVERTLARGPAVTRRRRSRRSPRGPAP